MKIRTILCIASIIAVLLFSCYASKAQYITDSIIVHKGQFTLLRAVRLDGQDTAYIPYKWRGVFGKSRKQLLNQYFVFVPSINRWVKPKMK